MKTKIIYFKFLPTDLAFWQRQEKLILKYYEQIDQRIGDYLTVTKSPCIDLYKQTKLTAMLGKMNFD